MAEQSVTVAALGIAIAARVPVLLWGAPGTGKTSAVQAMAAAADWPCETVIASIREPADFAGLPVVGTDMQVRLAPPAWAGRLVEAGRGVLFFDEISTAPPAVQAALLRVVLERTVGDLALPEAVSVVAAANPPEQAADGWDLSAPLANRFCHLDWPLDARAVAEGFVSGWPTSAPPELADGWDERIPVTRSWVAAYLTVRGTAVLTVPDDAAAAGRAWPSPRTWDMVARLLAAARYAGAGTGSDPGSGADERVTAELIRGCVGPGAGVEFLTWLVDADLPDPEAILADPDSFVLPERGDRAYAVLSSIAAAVAADPSGGRWTRAWRAFGKAAGAAPDIAAAAARTLARCRPPGEPVPAEIELFVPLLRDAHLLA